MSPAAGADVRAPELLSESRLHVIAAIPALLSATLGVLASALAVRALADSSAPSAARLAFDVAIVATALALVIRAARGVWRWDCTVVRLHQSNVTVSGPASSLRVEISALQRVEVRQSRLGRRFDYGTLLLTDDLWTREAGPLCHPNDVAAQIAAARRTQR